MATRLALEQIAANQYSTFNNGGKVMVSASVAGKSFSYQLQPGMNPAGMTMLALNVWKAVKDMTTPQQVEDFLTKSTGSLSYPQFNTEIY